MGRLILQLGFYLVLTVCNSAAEEYPVWLGEAGRVHHNFADPPKATGTQDEILAAFQSVRAVLAQNIPKLLNGVENFS